MCLLENAPLFSYVGALAIRDAIARVHNDDKLSLKWPNDVLLDGKKVSGILLEAESYDQSSLHWLVMGVGINIAHAPEQGTLFPATSLAREGIHTTTDAVRNAFLHYLHHWYLTFMRDGFNPIRRAWLTDAYEGGMTVHLSDGDLEGRFGGLTSQGALILRLADDTERVIHAGDVSLL
jgi:BirA family biotin operon repressor/biotin-[acetyl-CoA-carboxylase] ligase